MDVSSWRFTELSKSVNGRFGRQQRSFRQSNLLEFVDPSAPTQIQRYGMPIFDYVDHSAVRRLDRHQFQPFRVSGFATKSEHSLPPDPGSFNQLPTDSEDTRVRYVSHRSF
jgi:hypothetical protein